METLTPTAASHKLNANTTPSVLMGGLGDLFVLLSVPTWVEAPKGIAIVIVIVLLLAERESVWVTCSSGGGGTSAAWTDGDAPYASHKAIPRYGREYYGG